MVMLFVYKTVKYEVNNVKDNEKNWYVWNI